jgi:signal transduction histidine kinase
LVVLHEKNFTIMTIFRSSAQTLLFLGVVAIGCLNAGIADARNPDPEPAAIQRHASHQLQLVGYDTALAAGAAAEKGLEAARRNDHPAEGHETPLLSGKAHDGGDDAAVSLTAEERAWLAAHPDITFGYTDAFEPAVIVNPDGSYRGTLVDFLDLLNQRLGTDFKIIVGPIPEVFSQVSRKELAGVLSLHPDNADKRGYLKTQDYITSYPTVFTRKGVAFRSSDDLAGKRIAIIDNVFFSQNMVDLYGDGATLIKVKSALKGLERVKDGTADLFIGSSRNSYLLAKYQFFDLAATFQFYDHPTHNVMAVRNDWPQLVSILNKGLAAISVEEIESIKRKWLSVPDQKETIELTDEEQTWLAAHPDIRLGFTDALPPSVIVDEKGQKSGIYVDFLNAVNARLGTQIWLQIESIPDIIRKAQTKQVDGLIALHPDHSDKLGLSKTKGYASVYPTVFARFDTRFKSPADFIGKKIAILDKVHFSNDIIRQYGNQSEIVRVADSLEGFQKIQRGEVEFFISISRSRYLLHKYFLSEIVPKYTFFNYTEKFGMAIRPDWPVLVSILNKAIDSFSQQEIDELFSRWVQLPEKIEDTLLNNEEQAWLDQNHTVRVRTTDWPPYLIVKDNEPPQGIAIDYLKLIEERTGLKFEYDMAKQSFAEFLEGIKLRQGPDMTTLIAQSPNRERYLYFTTPYISSPYVIFARQQEDVLIDISGLAGKTLAVPKGFVIQQFLEKDYPEIRLVLFDNDEQSLVALSSGKVDAYIGNLTVASHLIQKRGLSNLRVIGSTPYGDQVLSMGNRNDWPELTAILNKALASITEAEKTAIRSKYVALRYEQGVDRADVVRWILIVVGGAFGIVIVFVFWNRSLGKKVNQRTRALQQEVKIRKQTEQELETYQERLKALASQLTLAEERERQRIAAELHDQVGQSLAFARMQLATAKKNTANEKLQDILNDVSVSMRQAVQDTRHIIYDLSSPAMREIGLRAAIAEWLEEEVQQRHGLQTAFIDKVDPQCKIVLPLDIRALMFRNVRELITNAVKHAQANQITVYAENTTDDIVIMVEDDGVGFEVTSLSQIIKKQGSFGLFSIKERMADLGGSLELLSEPGKGCQAILRMPLTLGEA